MNNYIHNFQIGDKIICIEPPNDPRLGKNPKSGEVCVVRGVGRAPFQIKTPIVYLVGYHSKEWEMGIEAGFFAWRFRSLASIQAQNELKRVMNT